MRSIFITLFLSIFLFGCAATPKPGSHLIRITKNADVVKDCKYISMVSGKDHWNGGTLGQGVAESNAYIYLKNNVHELNADTVVVVNISTGTSGSSIMGEAYKCD